MAVVETWKQLVTLRVIQSFDVGITTTRVEIVVMPNMEVVKRGILIGSVVKLGNGSSGISIRRNLNRSSTLPTTTTRVVGTPWMVFINLIMISHVNRIVD
jgi:ABC-type transporter Mla subunit MlaD